MDGTSESNESAKLQARLLYLAWRNYGIRRVAAEDLVRVTLKLFERYRNRFADPQKYARLLLDTFRDECRGHLRQQEQAIPIQSERERIGLASVVRSEDGRRLLAALAEQPQKQRPMHRLAAQEGTTRSDLIGLYGSNGHA